VRQLQVQLPEHAAAVDAVLDHQPRVALQEHGSSSRG
jgi:hypothetical protein